MQAVEGDDERVAAVLRQLLGAAVADLDVAQPRLGDPRPSALDGEARQLVAVERRGRIGLGERGQRHTGATADVGHERAVGEPAGDSLQRRHDRRHEREPRPWPEHPLGAMHAGGAVAVVWQPHAGAERVGEVVHEPGLRRGTEGSGGELQAVVLAREHHRPGRAQLEALAVIGGEQLCGRVPAQPLAQPAGMQARAVRQLLRRERPGAVELAI